MAHLFAIISQRGKFSTAVTMLVLFCCVLLCLSYANGFLLKGCRTRAALWKLHSSLDLGDLENVAFTKLDQSSDNIGKFRVEAKVTADDMCRFLDDYKEEMKSRKDIFPGFRPGKIPPHAMVDIRKYLVSHSIESIVGHLCNLNGLELCDEQGQAVPFPEDSYLEQIMQDDKDGKSFISKRDAWREGRDFDFRSEFYAKEEVEVVAESDLLKRSPFADQNVIDVETVDQN